MSRYTLKWLVADYLDSGRQTPLFEHAQRIVSESEHAEANSQACARRPSPKDPFVDELNGVVFESARPAFRRTVFP